MTVANVETQFNKLSNEKINLETYLSAIDGEAKAAIAAAVLAANPGAGIPDYTLLKTNTALQDTVRDILRKAYDIHDPNNGLNGLLSPLGHANALFAENSAATYFGHAKSLIEAVSQDDFGRHMDEIMAQNQRKVFEHDESLMYGGLLREIGPNTYTMNDIDSWIGDRLKITTNGTINPPYSMDLLKAQRETLVGYLSRPDVPLSQLQGMLKPR